MTDYPIPAGFRLAGVHAGLKANPDREDLTLVECQRGAVAAGVYTTNRIVAAPVVLDRQRTPSGDVRAVVVNSGNANACTGERGMEDARQMCRHTAAACGVPEAATLVMSTGIIGEYLPMERIAAGITAAAGRLAADSSAVMAAARGMMTTDKAPKLAARTVSIAGSETTLLGMAKGAGMIGPKMATMLGLVLTDARLQPDLAQRVLTEVADQTYNCISVEGHRSTNDTVLLLAGGDAHSEPLAGGDLDAFTAALHEVSTDLARAIPSDGEGATHLITIDVAGAAARDDAFRIAQTIANSPLVKTAIAGADPNWGRIVSAAGYAGVSFDPAGVSLSVNGMPLYRGGVPVAFDAAAASAAIAGQFETHVELTLAEGDARARFFTSDLTAEYIRINTDYHT